MMSRLSLSVHFPSYLKELVCWNLFGKGESTDNIGIFNVPWCLAVWQMLLVWYTTSIFLVTSRVCDFLISFFIFKITFYSFFENQLHLKNFLYVEDSIMMTDFPYCDQGLSPIPQIKIVYEIIKIRITNTYFNHIFEFICTETIK